MWNRIKLGLKGIPGAHRVQPSVESRALDLDDPGLCMSQAETEIISTKGDPAFYLGNLFQFLIVLMVKVFFLISSQNIP